MSQVLADLRYAKSHEWARTLSDGRIEVGITDHAQHALGDLVFVDVPQVGTTLEVGGACAVVESVKAARQAGDYLTAIDGSRELVKQLAGLPEQAEVKVVSDELAKDEAAQTVARAQKKVRDMRGQRLGKSKEREKALEDLQKVVKEHPGTKAAEEAQAFMAELRQRKT